MAPSRAQPPHEFDFEAELDRLWQKADRLRRSGAAESSAGFARAPCPGLKRVAKYFGIASDNCLAEDYIGALLAYGKALDCLN